MALSGISANRADIPHIARHPLIKQKNIHETMKTTATLWSDIPSLADLSVDWEYEPEDAKGKRKWSRINNGQLQSSLEVEAIPVKVVTTNSSKVGRLIDLSTGGLAVLLDAGMTTGQVAKIGMYLGRHKIVAKVTVRNACLLKGKYRIGMEFADLDQESSSFIASIIASKIYTL